MTLQHDGSEGGGDHRKKPMSECREAKGGVSMRLHRGMVMEGSKGRRQRRKEGRKEGDAGALHSRWSFRCHGNPSAACVASAQQYASDSPDPVKKNKETDETSVNAKDTSKTKHGPSEKSIVIPRLYFFFNSLLFF